MSQEIFNWTWLVLLIVMIVVRKIHEHKSGQRVSLKQTPFLEAVLMFLWGGAAAILPLLYVFGTRLDFADFPVSIPPACGFAGAGLFLIAIWLLHRSHADLGGLWSPTVEPDFDQQLVTIGIYRRIRHPMYAAHVLWGIAQMLLLPNWIAGPSALLLVCALLSVRIPREERAMIDEFGNEYRRYMLRTGRILPKLLTTRN